MSELIPLDRHLPDWRDPWCLQEYHHSTRIAPQLPKTSVIICFHNEAWSTLIRSLYSLIDRTPGELLEEVR